MKRLLLLLLLVPLAAAPARANNQFKGYINEVLYNPTGPDSSNQLVEIINSGTSTITLSNWSICVQFNYVKFPTGATLPPGGTYTVHINKVGTNNSREFFTGPYVNLNSAADGIGLFHIFSGFGTPANMEDYVEWGSTGNPRENVAISAGIWTTGNFVPLGPEGQSISWNNRTATPPNVLPHQLSDYCYATPSFNMQNPCAIVGPVILNEILADPTGPNAGATIVELLNTGTTSINLTGWQWTTQFVNGSFGVNQTLGAGKYLLIRMNAAGTSNDTTLFTGTSAVDLNPNAGSFALYKNSVDFTNPANLVDFVEWGATGQAREAEAIAASQWVSGDFVPAVAENHSIGHSGTGSRASAWCDQSPPTLRLATVCAPLSCACATIRINELLVDPTGDNTSATRVELLNTGASPVDIRNLNLQVGASVFAVSASFPVPAGGFVVVHLNETGPGSATDIYTGSALPDLPPVGSLGLFVDGVNFGDPARMLDFIEWGSGGQSGESVAASAGLWQAGTFFPGTAEGASVQWRGTGTGNAVDDFCSDAPTLGGPNACSTSGAPEEPVTAGVPSLRQNYPNPLSPGTHITFNLPRPEDLVSVTIYTMAGSPVRRLFEGPAPAGVTSLYWDGRDSRGRTLPGGIYVYALKTSHGVVTRKLVISR